MEIRRIMLITFLLLAILAIGAVSAADEITSDNLTVVDEAGLDSVAVADESTSDNLTVVDEAGLDSVAVADESTSDNLTVVDDAGLDSVAVADEPASDSVAATDDDSIVKEDTLGTKYDYYKYFIDVNSGKRINLDDKEAEIAIIYLPDNTYGQFRMLNGEEVIVARDIDYEYSFDEYYYCLVEDILVGDFNRDKIKYGDKIAFKFYELVNGQYVLDDAFSLYYKVVEYGSHMVLTEIKASEMTDIKGRIEVNSINTSSPYDNFAYVYVDSKDGTFIIMADDNLNGEFEIFREDLKTTKRPYQVTDDGKGDYRFGFSFNDINEFLLKNEGGTFMDLINDEYIDGNDMYFILLENNEDHLLEDYRGMSFNIGSDGIISFKDASNYYVDVEYVDLEFVMNEGWQSDAALTFYVRKGINGKMVIRLDDNETPVFEKSTVGLKPDGSDEKYNMFTVTLGDLNIQRAGKYIIRDSFVKDDGELIYEYNKNYPQDLILLKNKSLPENNVTITIISHPMVQNGDEYFITISANASKNDTVLVSVKGYDPVTIRLNETRFENESFLIGSRELKMKLSEDEHFVEVAYKDHELSKGIIYMRSNIEIEIVYGKNIYTTFEDIFVHIRLKDDNESIFSKTTGKINLTITNYYDKVKKTWQGNITDLEHFNNSYVIRSNVTDNLNGKYNVFVSYFDGNEANIRVRGYIPIKEFESEDYGASINESVKDANDYIVTFTKVALSKDILIEIDGNNSVRINASEVEKSYDREKGVYYINCSKLGISDGTHTIKVYADTENKDLLANGTVIVDVEENIDPSLTISITDIFEGSSANVVITTNETFSGDVLVKIGDSNYTVNVTKGSGTLTVSGLAVGIYNATAFFKANAFFNESAKNTTFAVNPKVATSITAPAVTATYATSKNIIVTLKDANGNPLAEKEVIITFNGASKTIKTNAKGQVSYAIGTELAPNKYDATFKFAGDSTYLASTGTVKVTVNKAKPKLTAKKKTFKAKKKVKKYTITLKSDKGKAIKKVKLTLKIKGKKYKAKTNNKGKATFKIKKLTKKGKHKATIKFAGNKYYNKVTKKVKITVKK